MVFSLGKRENDYDDDAASDMSTENFASGENVLLDGKKKARVAYFGPVEFSHDDDWVGIKLEEPVGKHSGMVAGTQYFKCDSMHGLFVRSHRLQRVDSTGRVTRLVKSPYRMRPKSSASMRSQDSQVEENLFRQAEQAEPVGFYEIRAGTVRPADRLESTLERMLEQINIDADQRDNDRSGQVEFASQHRGSSRTPTPSYRNYGYNRR